ncbi:MAG: L,D-transpeptidase family protein [Gammaproteobacteria bacterium]|jgi:murein L,D-transpeptidase YafK
MQFAKSLSVATFIALFASSQAAFAESRYESEVISSIDSIKKVEFSHSLQSLENLVDKYPNSKLGYLVMGDLLAARAGSMDLVERYAEDPLQLAGLRDELYFRWQTQTQQSPAARGLLPANLITSAPTERYVLAADASHSRLYVFENTGTSYRLVKDYFMTIGKEGMGKNKEGDLRTPEGVYFVTSYLDGEGLPERYGPGAFPINYPNEYDKKLRRTGYGIWIHGTEPENYNRVPLASDGCLSLSNDEFFDIQQFISTDGSTPVIISSKFDWVEPERKSIVSESAFSILDQWQSDWESLDTDKYLSHYSRSQLANFDQFAAQKHRVNKSKKYIEVDLNNVSIYGYPGNEDMMVVSFDQEYRSNNHRSVTQKRQYWKKQNGTWQIIHEG